MEGKATHISTNYMTYVYVWAALAALTALTVAISGLEITGLSVLGPFLIASVKAFLVLYFFMHLRYESGFFRMLIAVAIVTLVAVGWLVYSDVAYR